MNKLRQGLIALAACTVLLLNSLCGLPCAAMAAAGSTAPAPGSTGATPTGHNQWADRLRNKNSIDSQSHGAWPGSGQGASGSGGSHTSSHNGHSQQQHAQGGWTPPVTHNLDLSSTVKSFSASHLNVLKSVNLNLGGALVPITAGSLLTPAERIALGQVLRTGQQFLDLNQAGSAVGGSFLLTAGLSRLVGNLVIPQGVTALDNAGRTGSLSVSGTLNNFGNLYVFSTNPALLTATIKAGTIFNQSGAVISSQMPSDFMPALAAASNILSLRLISTNDITNAGTISSAGSLSLKAGGQIINAAPSNSAGALPLIQAANTINLFSGLGSITNGGLIAATAGNINIQSLTASNISIDSTGGTFAAPAGSINLRSPGFNGNAAIDITGGDFTSKELNVYNGSGNLKLSVDSIGGTLNVYAGEAHTAVANGKLTLGNLSLTGDPDFYDSSGSAITLTGTIQLPGENLAIISAGDILTSGTVVLDLSSGSTSGGSLLLIAGADFKSCNGGPCNGSSVLPPTPGNDTLVLKGFKDSGVIDLSAVTFLSTNGGGTAGNAGNISMYAPGRITIPAALTITADGSTGCTGTCAGGNITIQSGNTLGTAISAGNISANGGSGAGQGGGIIMLLATSLSLNGSDLIVTNGLITSGAVIGGALNVSKITAGILDASSTGNSDAGGITLFSGGTVSVQQLVAAAPGTGNGGQIFSVSTDFQVTGVDSNGVSINASSALGNAINSQFLGAVTIETKTTAVLRIFENAVQPPPSPLPDDYIAGVVLASGGVKGGSIFFQTSSPDRPIVNVSNVPPYTTEAQVLNVMGNPSPKNDGTVEFVNANFVPIEPRIDRHDDTPSGGNSLFDLNGRAGLLSGAGGGLTGAAISTDVTSGAPGSDDPADLPDVGDDEGMLSGDEAGPGLLNGSVIRTNVDVANITAHGFTARSDNMKDVLELDHGNMLVIPEEDMLVKTPESMISIGARSIAFIIKKKDTLAIYDLHHGKHGGIKVIADKKEMQLLPGKELVIVARPEEDFSKANPATRIAFRKPSKQDYGQSGKMYVAEFSIPSALMMILPLQKLLNSNEPYERKAYYQMLKNAAILADVTASGGEYITGAEKSQ